MNIKVKTRIQLFGAWCSLLYVAALLIGWWLLAGYLPPHPPTADAATIAAIYQDDAVVIRLGMIFVMFGAACYIPFTAVIAQQISRIEGGVGVLTLSQLMGGMGNVFLTFYPAIWWVIASFRPDRPAELIQLINDAAWLQFVGGLTPFLPILVSIAVASLADDSEQPVFPRWCGYLNLWAFVLFLPTQLIFFFKSGPFAWNGFLAFWLPLTVFIVWFVVMFMVLRKGILRQAAEQATG